MRSVFSPAARNPLVRERTWEAGLQFARLDRGSTYTTEGILFQKTNLSATTEA